MSGDRAGECQLVRANPALLSAPQAQMKLPSRGEDEMGRGTMFAGKLGNFGQKSQGLGMFAEAVFDPQGAATIGQIPAWQRPHNVDHRRLGARVFNRPRAQGSQSRSGF